METWSFSVNHVKFMVEKATCRLKAYLQTLKGTTHPTSVYVNFTEAGEAASVNAELASFYNSIIMRGWDVRPIFVIYVQLAGRS